MDVKELLPENLHSCGISVTTNTIEGQTCWNARQTFSWTIRTFSEKDKTEEVIKYCEDMILKAAVYITKLRENKQT